MNYFRLPYFLFKFKYHQQLKSKILAGLDAQESHQYDQIDDTDWCIDTCPYFDIFKNEFIEEIDKRFAEYHIGPWEIGKMWYQRYSTGNNHQWHKHPHCHWACVYYLELPEGTPGTLIRDPYSKAEVQLPIEEGDIFIFPSQIWHSSPDNLSDKQKIIVACNIDAHDV